MKEIHTRKYDEHSIKILEGLEAVRKRPGMYIGSTGLRGLHHIVWEIVDNSIDEAMAGYCTDIYLRILKGNIIQVEDNGRGIPTGIHPKTNKSAVETILTTLHAGGKFDSDSYKVSGGLHGVGASVCNALSEWFEVVVHQNNKVYKQEYERGIPLYNLKVVGNTNTTGTLINFKADPKVFTETTEYDYETLRVRAQQLAFLNKGIKIHISDNREDERQYQYQYNGGISEYVSFLNESKEAIHPNIIAFEDEQEGVVIDIAMQYTSSFNPQLYSFANNIHTQEGGTHEEGFRTCLTRVLNHYGKTHSMFRKDETLIGEDVRAGLTAIVSCKHPNPQFEGQTKTKLGNTETRKIASQVTQEGLERFLNENPNSAKTIIEKAILTARARVNAQKAREATLRKGPLDSLGLASKLADCRTKNKEISEIYIVEGNSAGGSAKQGRDSEFQAILPLRGKVLNVEKNTPERVEKNNEIVSMLQALGTGYGQDFDLTKLRYGKVIIMTDADVDGAHIRTLLLTFFYRYCKELLLEECVYIAQPPLYKISYGKKTIYAYTDSQLQQVRDNNEGKPNIQRYKGLGEMNAEQLWDTTMNPDVRTLLKVTIEDAIEADTIFSMLMGNEVAPRSRFIEKNAKYATNVDV